MPAVVPFIPLIASGISTAYGAYKDHKAGQAQASAQAPLTALAQQQGDQSKQLFNFGMPQLQKAAGYYGSLLSGNRAAVTSTLAPTVAQIGDVYKGAERNLTRMAPGAGRDEASASLNQQRAGQIGMLPIQARAGAADAVANLGREGVSSGVGATGGAASIYGNLLGDERQQQARGDQQQYQLGQNLSTIIGQFISAYRQRTAGGGGGSSGYPSVGGYGGGSGGPVTSTPW